MSATEPSVQDLRRESERTRAALAQTVRALRDKMGDTAAEIKSMTSPAHIKEEIRSYVRTERASITQSLQRQARDNPLQAVALTAAVAFPLLKALRALPGPVMLVGAGLWLTTSKGRTALGQVSARTTALAETATAAASDTVDALKNSAASTLNSARDGLSQASGEVAQQAQRLGEQASAQAAGLKDKLQSADTAHGVRQASQGLTQFVEDNPMLVAGLGAVIGAMIAAAVPESDPEKKMFRGVAQAARDNATRAASAGLDRMRDLAGDITDDVAAAAAREGVDPSTLVRQATDVMGGIKAIAERGLSTALEGADNAAAQTPPNQDRSGAAS